MKTAGGRASAGDFSKQVGAALRRAAKVARKTARMYGTPIYVWENGKVVAKKP
ncbi:MAG: hypothetical protein AABZ34_10705 [Nitrospirota bacterium]